MTDGTFSENWPRLGAGVPPRARVGLSARRAPRCRMALPECPTRCFTRAFIGSIFILCVHQRKVRLGGG